MVSIPGPFATICDMRNEFHRRADNILIMTNFDRASELRHVSNSQFCFLMANLVCLTGSEL